MPEFVIQLCYIATTTLFAIGYTQQLHCVYDTIFRFCAAQDVLFQDALAELARLRQKELDIERRTAAGGWGVVGGDGILPAEDSEDGGGRGR